MRILAILLLCAATCYGAVFTPGGNVRSSDFLTASNRLSEGAVNVLSFGAVGDNSTDDSAAFNSAFATCTNGGRVYIPPGTYYISNSISLPDGGDGVKMEVIGYGATLRTDQAISIFYRMPTNTTHASSMVGFKPVIRGITFEGSGSASQKGIEIGSTYLARVEDCNFKTLGIGLDAYFCLAMKVSGCRGQANATSDFVLQTGLGKWTSATLANSAGNGAVIENCRVYGKAGQTNHYAIYGCDGVVLRDCISEGVAPVYCVDYNDEGSTVVKGLAIDGFWAENNAPTAIFRLVHGGYVSISRVDASYPTKFFDTTGSTSTSYVKVSDVGYWHPSMTFSGTTAATYIFENAANTESDVLGTNRWASGVPGNAVFVGKSGSSGALLAASTSLTLKANNSGNSNSASVLVDGNVYFTYDNVWEIGRRKGTVTLGRPQSILVGSGGVNSVGSLISSNQVVATNGFVLSTNNFATVGSVTNGTAMLWNSNGWIYLRASRVGATNWIDALLLAAP